MLCTSLEDCLEAGMGNSSALPQAGWSMSRKAKALATLLEATKDLLAPPADSKAAPAKLHRRLVSPVERIVMPYWDNDLLTVLEVRVVA